MKTIIVKVQRALNANKVLIYNKDRSFISEYPCTDYVEDCLAGSLKRFFHAHIDKDGKLVLGASAPQQDW
jgi:hypothetical protein